MQCGKEAVEVAAAVERKVVKLAFAVVKEAAWVLQIRGFVRPI